jgi:hypothetical protein
MRKFNYLYVLQGHYGYGWEDLCAEDKSDRGAYKRIREDKKSYIENEKGSYRIISRRELNAEEV